MQSICRLLKIACWSYEVVLSTLLQTISKPPSPTRDRLVALQELGLVCIHLTSIPRTSIRFWLTDSQLNLYGICCTCLNFDEFIVLLFNVNERIKPRIELLCGWGQENLGRVCERWYEIAWGLQPEWAIYSGISAGTSFMGQMSNPS